MKQSSFLFQTNSDSSFRLSETQTSTVLRHLLRSHLETKCYFIMNKQVCNAWWAIQIGSEGQLWPAGLTLAPPGAQTTVKKYPTTRINCGEEKECKHIRFSDCKRLWVNQHWCQT